MRLRNKDFNKDILAIELQRLSKLTNLKLDIQFNRYSLKNSIKEDS